MLWPPGRLEKAAVRVPPEIVPDPGGEVPSRLPFTALQVKSRFSGSKTLASNPFQQFQRPKACLQSGPSQQSLKLQNCPSLRQPYDLDLNNLNGRSIKASLIN